jgi:hypothetical protein
MQEFKKELEELQQLTQFMQQHKGMVVEQLKKYHLMRADFADVRNNDVFFKDDAEYFVKCAFLRAKRYMNRKKRGRLPNIFWMFLNKELECLYKEAYRQKSYLSLDDPVGEDDGCFLHEKIACSKPLPDSNAGLEGDGEKNEEHLGDIFLYCGLMPIVTNLAGKVSQKTINLILSLTSSQLQLLHNDEEKFAYICEKLRCNRRKLKRIISGAYEDIFRAGLTPFRVLCENGKCEEYIMWAENVDIAMSIMSAYGKIINLEKVA